eukprot:CAMPEP_0117510786 /NCGR_PEP_ID=MMETSP0784-20121206/28167_1 /TAXON_ID=39447 /ORGANISM="" /LENGTH=202 /DNA_ID=CAMNT_0005306429 /DNA_START=44 /DNA_END=652 /DNA_ORIENTATION=+
MKGVNNESTNTDRMQQHQLAKSRVSADAMRHEDVDLMVCTDLIDASRSIALNGCSDHAQLTQVLAANPEDKALSSDVDHQLLLKVFFKERVTLSAVTLRFSAPPTDEDPEQTYSKPRLIKLYVNEDTLDFGDCDSIGPTSQVVVEDADANEVRISCVGHKYQRIGSLQVFVEEASNPEATRTFVNRVSVIGHEAQSYHAEYK